MTTLVLARALPPAAYGAYFVAVSTIIILATVGTAGMDQVVVRFAASCGGASPGRLLRRVILTCLGISVAGGTLAVAILAGGGPNFFTLLVPMPSLLPHLWIVVAWLFFATIQRQLQESFRGVNDIRLSTFFGGVRSSGILNSVGVCLVVTSLWALGALDLRMALLVSLGISVLVVVCAFVLLRKLIHVTEPQCPPLPDYSGEGFGVRKALHEGWPLWFATLLLVLNAMSGAWLAGAFDTASRVALFGVAQKVILLLVAPMQIVNAVLPPVVAKFHSAQDMSLAGRTVRMAAGVALLPSLFVFLIVALVGRPFLSAAFGNYYAAAFPLLVIIGIGQMINLATGAWQVVLPMTGSRMQMLSISAMSVIMQIGLGIYLGYRLGVTGVAIALAISMTLTNIIGMLVVRASLGVWTFAVINRQSVQVVNGFARTSFVKLRGRAL